MSKARVSLQFALYWFILGLIALQMISTATVPTHIQQFSYGAGTYKSTICGDGKFLIYAEYIEILYRIPHSGYKKSLAV
jgi:hypothetical protein